MPTSYRRPGVYLEEGQFRGPGQVGSAVAVAMFVGQSSQGPTNEPTPISSWTEFESIYGGFNNVTEGVKISYLPYAVYSYFQNGGRNAYIQRAIGSGGSVAAAPVFDSSSEVAFNVNARSDGTWGNEFRVGIDLQSTGGTVVYSFYVFREVAGGTYYEVERFTNLSRDGAVPGTKRIDFAVNDEVYGSKYVRISDVDQTKDPIASYAETIELVGGTDGTYPTAAQLLEAADVAMAEAEGPIILNVVGFHKDDDTFVGNTPSPTAFGERKDVFVINDNIDARQEGVASDTYGGQVRSSTSGGGVAAFTGNSYVASYTPWIVIADPNVNGGTITVPPGGAVAGVFARTDALNGVFQAPAGLAANLNNAINVDAKYSTAMQGTLNADNINVIRTVPGSGICIMGGRTRKGYGVDHYVNARRTLIYIEETLKVSTQFALFTNNDAALWAQLAATAERVLRPIWQAGGLKGNASSEAYQIICDDTINTPDVVASGEVRMEVGVALQTPAEFIVIRISQFEGGNATATNV